MNRRKTLATVLLAVALLFVLNACAPGNARWDAEFGAPANFWAGLWHGLIIVITFIVSLFTDTVNIYEVNNVGWGYDIGFLLGCMISLGGAIRGGTHRRRREKDWDKVGRQIGDSIREGLQNCRVERKETEPDVDWDELGRRIEERVREELKKHRS